MRGWRWRTMAGVAGERSGLEIAPLARVRRRVNLYRQIVRICAYAVLPRQTVGRGRAYTALRKSQLPEP